MGWYQSNKFQEETTMKKNVMKDYQIYNKEKSYTERNPEMNANVIKYNSFKFCTNFKDYKWSEEDFDGEMVKE